MIKFCIALIFSLSLVSCNKWADDPCKHRGGEKGKIEIPLQGFQHLEINQHLPCTIHYSDTPKVILYGPAGSLPFISAEVENDTLTLKNLNRCSWLRNYDQSISVEIYTPLLLSILQNGSADLTISDSFQTPKLIFYSEHYSGNVFFNHLITDTLMAWVNSSGSAYFNLNGKSIYTYLFIRGSSQIEATTWMSKTCHLVSYSNGNIRVQAPSEMLLGEIRYNGNIEVSRKPPQEKIVITGKGKYIYP